ncbi:MAG: phenylacetate--CoA ligase [Deltaproteobacteria bacterium]|nr:phenylacetate--CoA ligase [Deltaproteobacteria bacterium]
MSRYWQAELETMSRSDLARHQVEKLRETIRRAAKSPFYGDVFKQRGIMAEDVRSPADLNDLPMTCKEDLRQNFPYGLLAAPRDTLVRLHCSSGTTGNPTVIFHNRHDLDSWANLVARSLFSAGARPGDVFQNICGYGLFTGGLGFQYGAERLGALTIPAGAGNSRRQIQLMKNFGTNVIHAIPSYLARLHEIFRELEVDIARDTQLRLLVIGAEPHTEGQRRRIENLYGIKAFNSYGLSEMNGPGVAFECEYQNGLHLWEDAFLAEIVDPETLEPVPDGKVGELVMTTLDRQAMPIIRYRTRDLTRFLPGDCPCGRSHRRIDRITGRTDDMFIIKGCNVFPMQVEKILMAFPEIGSDYLIVLETVNGVDEMRIQVEVNPNWFTGEMEPLEKLRRRIQEEVRDEILLTPEVLLVEPGTLPKSEGKAVRVQDLRQREGE